jgi:hypothetical protein
MLSLVSALTTPAHNDTGASVGSDDGPGSRPGSGTGTDAGYGRVGGNKNITYLIGGNTEVGVKSESTLGGGGT